jgi:hypothetical protein
MNGPKVSETNIVQIFHGAMVFFLNLLNSFLSTLRPCVGYRRFWSLDIFILLLWNNKSVYEGCNILEILWL